LTSTTGTFRAHPRGFGFLDLDIPLADGTDSLFVPPPRADGLLDDDLLRVSYETDDRGGAVTRVHEIIARRRYVAGEIDGKGRLQTDATLGDHRLSVPGNPGQGVAVVELEELDDDGKLRVAGVIAGPVDPETPAATRLLAVTRAATREALGDAHAPAEIRSSLADQHFRGLLAAEAPTAMKVRRRLSGHVPGADLEREDLTDMWTVTIDGPSTKDLDDAVSAHVTDDGDIRLHVHIADVAAHVPIGSTLDRRAITLATSTYLADHTSPMLPVDLSEGDLSLVPGEERDTMTIAFTVTRDGDVMDVEPLVSRTFSDARLTYQDVQRHLDGHGDLEGETARTIDAMADAAEDLGGQRDARSTLRGLFTPAESQLVVDGDHVERIDADPYADATNIIERLMVAANESVATWLGERSVPSIYRVHQGVDPTRAERLDLALTAAGFDPDVLSDGGYRAGPMADVLEDADSDEADAVAQTAADAMGRAGYTTDPAHHFGLDSKPYTHFTSPIRRVADLLVHRQLRATMAGETPAYDTIELDELADWIDVRSGQSARAEALQRSLLWSQWCQAELDAGRRPKLDATIRKLTPAGLLVRIDAYGVTGFIPASTLPRKTLERGRLKLAKDQLTDESGSFRVGGTAPAEFAEVDESGRLTLHLAA
jgi:ribonuclease R